MTTGKDVDVLQLIALGLAVVAVAAAIWVIISLQGVKRRLDASLGGTDAGSLESTLTRHMARVEQVDKRLAELDADYERLAVATSLASQKIAIIRFNPFGDTGGDQSFSLAVLDAHDSGYVLTSIHGREGTRVYVKPVDYGKSKHTLSAEEKQALGLAERRVPKLTEG